MFVLLIFNVHVCGNCVCVCVFVVSITWFSLFFFSTIFFAVVILPVYSPKHAILNAEIQIKKRNSVHKRMKCVCVYVLCEKESVHFLGDTQNKYISIHYIWQSVSHRVVTRKCMDACVDVSATFHISIFTICDSSKRAFSTTKLKICASALAPVCLNQNCMYISPKWFGWCGGDK